MKTVTTASFEADVLKSNKPVLVDFGAEWCHPCKALKPVLNSISEERTDIDIVYVDVDESDALTSQYGIRSVPTLILFNNGEALERVGNVAKPKIEEFLDKHLI